MTERIRPAQSPDRPLRDTTSDADFSTASQQVSWWPVHEYVGRLTAGHELPWPGTPEWCALADDHADKIRALAPFAEHWALRVETAQQARAEASRGVAGSTDWAGVAADLRQRREATRTGAYIPREQAS